MTRGAAPELQAHWDWRAVANFIGGGSGTGLFLFATIAALADPEWLRRAGLPALLLVMAGLAGVGLELGRPDRALNVFRRARTSWMSREALAATGLLSLGLPAAALSLRAVALVAALFGLAMLYAQGRLLRAAKGIPAWREPRVTPLVLVTGLTEGAGLMAALAPLADGAGWAAPAAIALTVVRLALVSNHTSRLTRPGAAPQATVRVLRRLAVPLVVGHDVSAGLLLAAMVTGRAVIFVGGGLLAAAVGWYLKFVLIARASYTQGFALAHSPARTPGHGRPGVKPGW